MPLANNALYVTNPAKASPNIGTTTEPFTESEDPTGTLRITELYRRLLLREPDGDGLAYWSSIFTGGTSIAAIENAFTSSSEGRPIFANTYNYIFNNAKIDPQSGDTISADESLYDTATASDIATVKAYQDKLAAENTVKQTLLDETNSNLNYTVMSMTIWVPLGILVGYYLYKKNFGVLPKPA